MMVKKETENLACLDVAIIGGGPAGISAGLVLSKQPGLKVGLFEKDTALGGMPRSCHIFFGMRDRKRLYTGPAYARKLDRLIRATSVRIRTGTMVLNISPGDRGAHHRLAVLSPAGLKEYACRYVLVATGCCESSRHKRRIPGSRPSGIFTTGALQQLVNLDGFRFDDRRAVVVGSEHVAFSSVLTLRHAGASVAAMVEPGPDPQSYPLVAAAMQRFYGFPIFRHTSVAEILGHDRVEGVRLIGDRGRREFTLPCDMVVLTGRFQPESSLLDHTGIARDPSTTGPVIDSDLLTSVPKIFAAGNVLRGADMHDLCALEGRCAATAIVRSIQTAESGGQQGIPMKAERPIRYIVPQKLSPERLRPGRPGCFLPGFAFQVEATLRHAVLEARSGSKRIWSGSFRKLLANNRYPLPVEKFDWRSAAPEEGVVVSVASARESFRMVDK